MDPYARTAEADLPLVEDTPYQKRILSALQSSQIYAGTVPAHIKARSRAKGKVARRSRRANRG